MDVQSMASIFVNTAMVLVLILIAAIDAKSKIINQKLLFVLLFGSIGSVYASKEINFINSLAAMLLIFLILSFTYIVSRKGIGWGDVKLCTCIAPYLGIERAFTMIVVSILICGVVAIALMTANKANRNREVPFAPFVVVGTIATFFL